MGIRSLNSESEARVVAGGKAVGTANYNTTPVDLQNYEGVRFIIPVSTNTNTATVVGTFAEGATTSAFNTLVGTSVSFTGSGSTAAKVMLADIYRPKDRYIRATVTRATANTTMGPVVAELYGAHKLSVSNSTAYGIVDTDTVFSPST